MFLIGKENRQRDHLSKCQSSLLEQRLPARERQRLWFGLSLKLNTLWLKTSLNRQFHFCFFQTQASEVCYTAPATVINSPLRYSFRSKMHLSFSRGDLCSNLVSLWHALLNFPKLSDCAHFFLIPLYLSDSTPSQAAVTVRKEKKKKTSRFPVPKPQALRFCLQEPSSRAICAKEPAMWPVSADRCLTLQHSKHLATLFQVCSLHKEQRRPILCNNVSLHQ